MSPPAGRGGRALAPIVDEVQAAPQFNGDETGWKHAGKGPWLWTVAAACATLFCLTATRRGTTVRALSSCTAADPSPGTAQPRAAPGTRTPCARRPSGRSASRCDLSARSSPPPRRGCRPSRRGCGAGAGSCSRSSCSRA
ncbi:MAG: transposase [Chloroflexales bacterium]|nr:transposase [Chloroflexales bacterium]